MEDKVITKEQALKSPPEFAVNQGCWIKAINAVFGVGKNDAKMSELKSQYNYTVKNHLFTHSKYARKNATSSK